MTCVYYVWDAKKIWPGSLYYQFLHGEKYMLEIPEIESLLFLIAGSKKKN